MKVLVDSHGDAAIKVTDAEALTLRIIGIKLIDIKNFVTCKHCNGRGWKIEEGKKC